MVAADAQSPPATTAKEAPSAPVSGAEMADEAGRRARKPYTIKKSRENWTDPEHDKFIEALQLFDRDWKKIEAYIGTKTVIQIRSHAQKYFLKVQKSGTAEHLPPPRPKRKAAHPYPQKATKIAPMNLHVVEAQQPLANSAERKHLRAIDSSKLVKNSSAVAVVSSRENDIVHPVGADYMQQDQDGGRSVGESVQNNCCSSTESPSGTWPTSEATERDLPKPSLRVMPDFAQVYSFLGSVFDPNSSGHMKKLKEMDPIDVETVLLLMRNLSINLISPDFESHRRLLSSYNGGMEKAESI